ncbi:MAG: HPr(Ser) kinase/phosphatase [Candidatus Izemoplasmatales bacterium]|jgi:HPr kinase/phosphorylase|nr:HPr(Ser) kinase/phosphatase [bacterium]MDZ4196743.1 HPr(Ser) kinase/phosphatase [Candidatus Izemoplasmatales bacterium]
MQKLTVQEVIQGLKLEVLAGQGGVNREVTNPSLSKPGLELAGLFDFYEHDRIQIIGSKEGAFFHWLDVQDQEIRVRMLFEKQPPAFVFSKNVVVPEVFIRFANQFQIPVCKSTYKTSSLFSELFAFLQAKLAERTTLHGVLLDINGVGVVITGKSGVGKSEVALELVRRGYMLVADDIVEIYQREKGIIIGEAPDVLKKYLEIRGIGIVNVVYLYGVRAYRENKRISMIVNLEKWDDAKEYNRLGLEEDKRIIFDTEIVHLTIPITEARNTATLVEAAANDYKSKHLGYHSANDFNDALNNKIKQNAKKE